MRSILHSVVLYLALAAASPVAVPDDRIEARQPALALEELLSLSSLLAGLFPQHTSSSTHGSHTSSAHSTSESHVTTHHTASASASTQTQPTTTPATSSPATTSHETTSAPPPPTTTPETTSAPPPPTTTPETTSAPPPPTTTPDTTPVSPPPTTTPETTPAPPPPTTTPETTPVPPPTTQPASPPTTSVSPPPATTPEGTHLGATTAPGSPPAATTPTASFVLGSSTLPIFVLPNSSPSPAPTAAPPPRPVVVGSQTVSENTSNGAFVLGSLTLTPGETITQGSDHSTEVIAMTVVSGTAELIIAGPSGTTTQVLGTVAVTTAVQVKAQPTTLLTVGGHTYAIGGATLNAAAGETPSATAAGAAPTKSGLAAPRSAPQSCAYAAVGLGLALLAGW